MIPRLTTGPWVFWSSSCSAGAHHSIALPTRTLFQRQAPPCNLLVEAPLIFREFRNWTHWIYSRTLWTLRFVSCCIPHSDSDSDCSAIELLLLLTFHRNHLFYILRPPAVTPWKLWCRPKSTSKSPRTKSALNSYPPCSRETLPSKNPISMPFLVQDIHYRIDLYLYVTVLIDA